MVFEEQIEQIIQNIRTGKKAGKTSPHKYILLLSILSFFENNEKRTNRFKYEELEPVYIENFEKYFDFFPDYQKVMDLPFYHLQSDGFWTLHAKPGKENLYKHYQSKRLTRKRLIETVEYGFLNDELIDLFKNSSKRHILKAKLEEFLLEIREDYRNASENDMKEKRMSGVKTSLFSHEQNALDRIAALLSKNNLGNIISNILIYDRSSNNYFEIDALLVSNYGMFVIELKHWTGLIEIESYNWVVNQHSYREDPHKTNSFKAKLVKGAYQHHFKTYPNVWVQSVVVLTNPDADVDGASSPTTTTINKTKNVTFSAIDDLITYLMKQRAQSPSLLSNMQVRAVTNYFQTLERPAQTFHYNVTGHETVEYLSQTPHCIELLARPYKGIGKGLERFRVFRTPHDISESEKKRMIQRAYNTIKSVSQIGDHLNIQKVWIHETETGDIIECSDWSETGTLRDLILKNDGVFSIEQTMEICYGIASALKTAHENDVIHRAVKPENILMANGIPKLMNFDLAFQVEDERITVIEDVSQLKDDGYIAPEVLLGKDIDETTDYYSLAVIAYELLTRKKPAPATKSFIASGGKLNSEKLSNLKSLKINETTIETIRKLLLEDRSSRINDANQILQSFMSDKHIDSAKERKDLNPNYELKPGETHDVYKIVKRLSKGNESQTYRAKTLRGNDVTIKLFNREVPREKIFVEEEIMSKIDSPYVVRSLRHTGYWQKERYFITMEYLPGMTLREIIDKNEKPDLSKFNKIALGLMEALIAFHYNKDEDGKHQPILHNDVKPDNIIITKDERGVLIDCGISCEPQIGTFKGTFGYVPPDALEGSDMSFTESGDIFALGVTLWEWLFGEKPYEHPSIGLQATIPKGIYDELPEYLKLWLLKAVDTKSEQRFLNVKEMKEIFVTKKLLKNVDEELDNDDTKQIQNGLDTPFKKFDNRINNFVSYLNTFINNSAKNEAATAELQIINENFKRIKVDNPITAFIYEKLRQGQNVILTGNAGDGKTTIAAEIFYKLTGKYRALKQKEEISKHGISIVKDMSEIEDKAGLLQEAIDSHNTFLIVSNTGAILENFRKLKHFGSKVTDSKILEALQADAPCDLYEDKFLVVNIGRLDNIKTACNVLKRILEESNWSICAKCEAQKDCPIYTNVTILQESCNTVIERILLLYRRLFEYNIYLTIRHMTGHLAYSVTGGLDCKEIQQMSVTGREINLQKYLFYNRFFGDDGYSVDLLAQQSEAIKEVQKANFGVGLDPYFERKVWLEKKLPFQKSKLLKLIKDFGGIENFCCKSDLRKQFRRLVYFFGDLKGNPKKSFISSYLGSPMLLEYDEILSNKNNMSSISANNLRNKIIHVMQEHFIGLKLSDLRGSFNDLFITLRQGNAPTGAQLVLAELRIMDFSLVTKIRYEIGLEQRKELLIQYKNNKATLKLDLPFLDYVARSYKGEITQELSPFYSDRLERFKVALVESFNTERSLNEDDLYLITIDPNRKFKFMRITISDDQLEVML